MEGKKVKQSVPHYYTVKEFAELHGVSPESISMKVNRGMLKHYKVGEGLRSFTLIPEDAEYEKGKRGRPSKNSKVETSGKSKVESTRKSKE